MVEAFAWGLLAGSSLVIGALVVWVHDPHPRALGLVMGFGAGVLLSAVSFELIDEAVTTSGGLGGTALGFFAGAVVFTVGDWLIARQGYRHRKDIAGAPMSAGPLAIVLGTVLDGVPESAVLGLTLLESGSIGVSMLVAVFVSNLPESIAATSTLLASGWSRAGTLALWGSVALVSALSAAVGYAALDGASPRVIAFVLAFAAGAILTMLATSMMPEGYEHAGRPVGLVTVLGFATAFTINWAAG